jgi:GNAT superfamily N-acetyltransferase
MRILEYAELSPSQQRRAAGTEFSDGDPPSIAERVDRVRVRGERFLGYVSLHAVDRGVPVARVGSTRVTFVPARGDAETVCGIADVITRSDALRRRFATRLIEASHARARAEGLRWAFLWTHRAWAAHRLYERLGYRDVYSPALVTRRSSTARPSRRRPVRLRIARSGDAARLERLYSEASAGRVGFCRRPRGWFSTVFRLGWRSPGAYRLVYADGRPVGYVHLSLDRFDLVSREVVIPEPEFHGPFLDALERLARGRWIGIRSTTFLRDAALEVARHGYDRVPYDHAVMMACPLRAADHADRRRIARTIADPRFALHGGDMI